MRERSPQALIGLRWPYKLIPPLLRGQQGDDKADKKLALAALAIDRQQL